MKLSIKYLCIAILVTQLLLGNQVALALEPMADFYDNDYTPVLSGKHMNIWEYGLKFLSDFEPSGLQMLIIVLIPLYAIMILIVKSIRKMPDSHKEGSSAGDAHTIATIVGGGIGFSDAGGGGFGGGESGF